jgi:hypothetical protein
MLENLAQDDTFRGYVLCEFHMEQFVADYPFGERENYLESYLRFYRQRPSADFMITWFWEALSERSALVGAKNRDFAATLYATFKSDLANSGRNPVSIGKSPTGAQSSATRFQGLNLLEKDNSANAAKWVRLAGYRAAGKCAAPHVPSWVEAIRRRGGDVVFIRLPVSGLLSSVEDQAYPDRDSMIQSLASRNITVIDFAKESTLRQFQCPDGAHLDVRDAERFSAALARILRDRGLFTRVRRPSDNQKD